MVGQESLTKKKNAGSSDCVQCSGRRKWLQSQLGTQAAKTPGLMHAAVKLSQGSIRANDGSGSGGGNKRRLVAALVTAKARKCRGRLCYGSGRDWNAGKGSDAQGKD